MAQTEERMYEGSIPRAVMGNIIPAMTASLLTLVYNLADSFFIGQIHNDLMQASVSLAAPVFLIFMSMGTLFGVGGSSLISRSLGAGNRERADHASAFSIWTCFGVGIIYMIIMWTFMEQILVILGASTDVINYTRTYLSIVSICGPFGMSVNCFSNIIRSSGKVKVAMTGSIIGNILNTVLDAVFILGLGWGVAGAAAATVVGNVCASGFYIIYILRGKYAFSANIRDYRVRDGICTGVLGVGIPAALTGILMSVVQVLTNAKVAAYGDLALAAYAMASKVKMCFSTLGTGMQQGVQPMLAYFYGAKNKVRFKKTLQFSLLFSVAFYLVVNSLCFAYPRPVLELFLTEESALEYGVVFTRFLLLAVYTIGVYDVLLGVIQGTGAAFMGLMAALLRRFILYIPLLFLMEYFFGVEGLVLSQTVAELLSLVVLIFMAAYVVRRFMKEPEETAGEKTAETAPDMHSD